MNPRGITLGAQDSEDLEILSARLQDAVAKVGDLVYLPRSRRFAALFNRFKWEEAGGRRTSARVRAGLYFNDVTGVKAQNLRRDKPDAVVSLLAIRFAPKGGGDPGGEIELVFAGGGALRLDVECIDAGLSDVSGEWAALGRPSHGDGG
jgi:hypothetical protein